MECANTNKGSYAWKSLLQARHIVDLGASWRIGNGESTLTGSDKWLPKHPPARIASPPATLPLDSKVSVLIDEVKHSWNSTLVRVEFLAHEANVILGIPLSYQAIPDEHVWFLTKNGQYSTRSGYHLLAGVERNVNPAYSNSEMKHKLWNCIWGLQTPHKVKHMIRRATHNAIPTLRNLWKRKVVDSVQCSRCLTGSEDMIHALWSCLALYVI